MTGKIISVVIPVYNGEKYLTRAVESVVSQPEGRHIQVIVVDDGSLDSSGEIADALEKKYDNIRVIHKENGGLPSARNAALEIVSTKYVAFLDCDDWWEDRFFDAALLAEFAGGNSNDIYQFAYRIMDNSRRLAKTFSVKNEEFRYSEPGLGRYDWTHPCSFIHRVSLLKEHGISFPEVKIGEDFPFILMALFHAASFKRINKVIFYYYENFNSMLHMSNDLTAVVEMRSGFLKLEHHFENFGVNYDAEANHIWNLATYLPKICAEKPYAAVSSFMDEYCFDVLERRPDICLRAELWNRIISWKKSPKRTWFKYWIKMGIPLRLKSMLLRIPVIGKITNYLYNRYYRGLTPVKNK